MSGFLLKQSWNRQPTGRSETGPSARPWESWDLKLLVTRQLLSDSKKALKSRNPCSRLLRSIIHPGPLQQEQTGISSGAELNQAESQQWREPCSHPHRKPVPGHIWMEGMGMRQEPLLPSLPISLKGCRKGSFLLSGAALACQACVPCAASFPSALSGKPAAVPSQPGEAQAGCPAQSLIRLFFIQLPA